MTLLDRVARAATAAPLDGLLTGDGDVGGERLDLPDEPPTSAAVLVAVTRRAEPGLLLTVRNADLRRHAGQIAFPGGRTDPGEDAVAAALREAREEIGLDPAVVSVVGTGDPYRTVTGYVVTPVIALVPPDLPLSAQEAEVADIFEAPLAYLVDPAHQRLATMHWRGRARRYYEIEWEGRRIWGATAAMIVNLSRRLQAAA